MCLLLQCLSNPATAVVQLPACYLIGELVLGGDFAEIYAHVRANPVTAFSGHNFFALYLGSFVLGPLLGVLGYLLTKFFWREQPPKANKHGRHHGAPLPHHPHKKPV